MYVHTHIQIFICSLEKSGSPNIGSCLLNQKLQMLNCCIAKKMARENKQNEREKCPEDALESDAGIRTVAYL